MQWFRKVSPSLCGLIAPACVVYATGANGKTSYTRRGITANPLTETTTAQKLPYWLIPLSGSQSLVLSAHTRMSNREGYPIMDLFYLPLWSDDKLVSNKRSLNQVPLISTPVNTSFLGCWRLYCKACLSILKITTPNLFTYPVTYGLHIPIAWNWPVIPHDETCLVWSLSMLGASHRCILHHSEAAGHHHVILQSEHITMYNRLIWECFLEQMTSWAWSLLKRQELRYKWGIVGNQTQVLMIASPELSHWVIPLFWKQCITMLSSLDLQLTSYKENWGNIGQVISS